MNNVLVKKLLLGESLREADAQRIFAAIFSGKLTASLVKTVLLLMARNRETTDELCGCLSALKQAESPYSVDIACLMDTCGTGGDGRQTINVSTLSALIVAGAGGKVAKHGNRCISSKTGSSDLMEAFGVNLNAPRGAMIESIRRYGIGYFHAPYYHPVFNRLQPLRRSLKIRTLFNLLGPLANPLKIKRQMIGVSKPDHVKLFAQTLSRAGLEKALVCHSRDGLDECSTRALTQAALIEGKKIRFLEIDPRQYGFKRTSMSAYQGGSVRKNHRIAHALLTGKLKGPMRDLILLNAGIAVFIAGLARDFREGIERAESALDSLQAYRSLQGLIKLSNREKHS